ncbi:MAG: ADP-ribosylglycohydrolase family protein [Desulfobulbus sp.]|jgi:ADP-ribosylglycohydrolase|uniref:ADP-ribosylglycohydrolase family protein n=1 Tax=Desulfobulbus sp. TaxID=895 RepID=UPI00284CBF62|nr:ADP-ribosylglycohydrolase family protein [Desulfobulbus sp.]MDR2551185.1 ADP-ribosylglycohydrolase family protein [Desulfobulbus sp.]
MTSQAKAMVLASFVADSLALGAHWIYDTAEIDRQIGQVDRLLAPLPGSYHDGKKSGDFTHYGDQTLVLLESLARNGEFSLPDFAADWQRLFTDGYRGYIDKATAATLDNMGRSLPLAQCGSQSSDLGGAARIAPLVYRYRENRERLLEAVRQQTAVTHNNPATLAGADFLAKTAWAVLHGTEPAEAMTDALDEGVADFDLDIRIRAGLDSGGKDTRSTIKHFGQMCGIAAALPGVVHLVLSYPDDLRTALVENVMAGGDSAARGLAAGMILGATLGEAAIPEAWARGLTQEKNILQLIADIDRLSRQ